MAFQLSPGVTVSEVDLSTVIPSVSSSIGAFAGVFDWGPVEEIVTVTNELRLVDSFARPTSSNYEFWYSAANFLSYSNNLKVVRAASNTTSKNATSNTGSGVLIKNSIQFANSFNTGANTYGMFAARYPGSLGNSISVYMADRRTATGWTYSSNFTDDPGTSDYVSTIAGANSNDEVHIVVVDTLGKFSGGVAGTVLEQYGFVSKASDAKTQNGSTNYYKDVINGRSRYIWALSHPEDLHAAAGDAWGTAATALSANGFKQLGNTVSSTLSGGTNGTVTDGDIQLAYNTFNSADDTDISLIITGPANTAVSKHVIDNIADVRKDCVVFISPKRSDVVDNYGNEVTSVISTRNTIGSSSYAVMDCNWKYQYDKYNDSYRWVPLNGDIAGLCARTDYERDPWFSPAGTNRGVIKNVVKLAWNPSKADRDDLYVKGVNPVVTFAGEGTILYGDKTLLSRPSAFDRINVRRLFIVLEKAIAVAARSSLFEFNDQFTRSQFVNIVEPYLRDVQGRRGITDFRVVCDERNNTPEVIDRNEFVGDIYIKPARSTNFIQLNFIAVRSGVSFDEIVGRQI